MVGAGVLTAVVLLAPAAHASTAAGSGGLPGGPVPAPGGAGVPAPIVILAVFAALFVLAAATAGVVRLLGWDPAWRVAWRHSWQEAEYRIAGGWLAVRDRFKRERP